MQMQVEPVNPQFYWTVINNFFSVLFLLELLINMYGLWFWPFWRGTNRAWNIFDTFVVCVGVIDMTPATDSLPGPVVYIRMFRAFRIFRLFSRVDSMKKIITAIIKALPGVRDAFLINLIVMMIYAVLAVETFGQVYCDEKFDNYPTSRTPRGECFGFDYYGNFLRALYTLFQILTGESWSEGAVRPLLHYYDSVEKDTSQLIFTVMFFITFILINAVVLLNVVVAVLMDGMSKSSGEGQSEFKSSTETEATALRQEVSDLRDQLAEQNRTLDAVLCHLNQVVCALPDCQ